MNERPSTLANNGHRVLLETLYYGEANATYLMRAHLRHPRRSAAGGRPGRGAAGRQYCGHPDRRRSLLAAAAAAAGEIPGKS